MNDQVLLLTPSNGLGGGIERYVTTLEWAFNAKGVPHQRVDLRGSGAAAHARMLGEARWRLQASPGPTRLVVAHKSLLPVASLLARGPAVRGISVVCHGSDVWNSRRMVRRLAENRLMRNRCVRTVAVSSFTAGALAQRCRATILPPGLSAGWFQALVDTSATVRQDDSGVVLVTVFRLADWRDKGLPELLTAVQALHRPDVLVTVCGSGKPPEDLLRLVSQHRACTLRSGLSDLQLARQLAEADLCVLATRTRQGRNPSGEGFGMVLLEAQVAGTAVVGPAYGGSHDAYLDRVTGMTPADETPEALTAVLGDLIEDQERRAQMSRRAAAWARQTFAPDRYAALVVRRLL